MHLKLRAESKIELKEEISEKRSVYRLLGALISSKMKSRREESMAGMSCSIGIGVAPHLRELRVT